MHFTGRKDQTVPSNLYIYYRVAFEIRHLSISSAGTAYHKMSECYIIKYSKKYLNLSYKNTSSNGLTFIIHMT